MRRAAIRTLVEIAENDPRVLLLTGDLGYMVVEPFADRFPDRFFNVGVAEQNLVGMATGLAEAGFVPYVYSIATFASARPYEFIRNGPLLHELPVRIFGVGGGFEYGHAGPTHHAIEDFGILRVQPGMSVVAPADHVQAAAAIRATHGMPGPVYFRIGKDDTKSLDGLDGRFQMGRAHQLRPGREVTFVTTGAIAFEVLDAADRLRAEGTDTGVILVASLSPAPQDDLAAMLADSSVVITVEAHSVTGGLGSLVCEVVAERRLGCRVIRRGITSRALGKNGTESFLNDVHGISGSNLAGVVRSLNGAV